MEAARHSIADWPPHTPIYLEVDWGDITPIVPAPAALPVRRGPVQLDYDMRVFAFKTGA